MDKAIQANLTVCDKPVAHQVVILLCLFMPGIVLAGFISHNVGQSLSIVGAAIIILAALVSVVRIAGNSAVVIQKLICLYFVCVLAEQASSQYMSVSVTVYSIKLSYSVAVVALCVVGLVGSRLTSISRISTENSKDCLIAGWALTLVVIVLHMLLLWPVLWWRYGYGYERDIAIVGRVSMCFLLCLLLWQPLMYRALRIGIASTSVVYALSLLRMA